MTMYQKKIKECPVGHYTRQTNFTINWTKIPKIRQAIEEEIESVLTKDAWMYGMSIRVTISEAVPAESPDEEVVA